MNIFELASRQKLRFTSSRGLLTTEQLWDLPLLSKAKDFFDLNSVAMAVNSDLKSFSEESFVETKNSPEKERLGLMLEVVKHIIGVKQQEQKDREAAAEKKAKRERLIAEIGKRQDDKIGQMTEDELRKQLEELDK